MQYALMDIDGRHILVSADEVHALDTYVEAIVQQEAPIESGVPFHVCYGCYMPQPGKTDEEAKADFEAARDHWLGFIEEDRCHVIALHDAEPVGSQRLGRALRIPFAALVQAHQPIIERIGDATTRRAVTGFLRYANLSPADNILNRPGALALKGIERRLSGASPVSRDDWRKHIDPDRCLRMARAIR